MSIMQTSYVHRLNTFFGAVEVDGDGTEAKVRVTYNGEALDARLNGEPVEWVAEQLLHELVVHESLARHTIAARFPGDPERALSGTEQNS